MTIVSRVDIDTHPSNEADLFLRRMLGEFLLGDWLRLARQGEPCWGTKGAVLLSGELLIVAALKGWKAAAAGTSSYLPPPSR